MVDEKRRRRNEKGTVACLLLHCDNCGVPFLRNITHMGSYYDFCSAKCKGQWRGKHQGFAAHPENMRGRTTAILKK